MVNIISSTKLDQNVDQWGYNVIKRSTDVSQDNKIFTLQ